MARRQEGSRPPTANPCPRVLVAIPAKAGIQASQWQEKDAETWVPVFAGSTAGRLEDQVQAEERQEQNSGEDNEPDEEEQLADDCQDGILLE